MTEHRSGRFAIVLSAAVTDERINHAAFRVMAMLSTYADKDGWCWPSQVTMAERLHTSRGAVRRALTELETFGYLQSERRSTDDGRETSKIYRLIYDSPGQGGWIVVRRGLDRAEPDGLDHADARTIPKKNDPTERSERDRIEGAVSRIRGQLLGPSDYRQIDDWIERGATVADFEEAAKRTVQWNPERPWAAFKSELGGALVRRVAAADALDRGREAWPTPRPEDIAEEVKSGGPS